MKEAQRSQHRKGWLLFDNKQELLNIFRNELENASGFMFVFKEEQDMNAQEIKETSKICIAVMEQTGGAESDRYRSCRRHLYV